MKQLLIIIATCAFILPVHSQNPDSYTDKRNEINIGFFNAFEMSNISELGIGYKRMVNNGAWRTGTGLSFSTNNNTNDEANGSVQTDRYYRVSPRIGYEFHKYYKRIQLQYGTDLVTTIFRGTLEDVNENIDYYRSEDRKDNKVSIRPFLGLNVFITKSISISTEAYLDLGYSYNTFEQIENDNNYSRTNKSASMYLGPLGIFSINFHL